jgi:uncharacterized membrane protein
MNSRQRNVVVAALVVAALMVLVPPWSFPESNRLVEYRPFFVRGNGQVHVLYLVLQVAALGLAAAAVCLLSADRKD